MMIKIIFSVNIGAALETGGGGGHLTEQLASNQIPSPNGPSFIELEHTMGVAFKEIVITKILTAGQVEKQMAIEKGSYHNGIPARTAVMDGGWSKRSHKHSYNVNFGVG